MAEILTLKYDLQLKIKKNVECSGLSGLEFQRGESNSQRERKINIW